MWKVSSNSFEHPKNPNDRNVWLLFHLFECSHFKSEEIFGELRSALFSLVVAVLGVFEDDVIKGFSGKLQTTVYSSPPPFCLI